MDSAKLQLIDRLKEANNVLVTVSSNPSVDQLSAAIGLSLALNKLGKHAIAVFSGKVPNTIEFLKPDETLAQNTDSLRDFIIALDKTKADKLRYKVEDSHVKIFITPYRTAITQDDLEFSQGEFNVDLIVALGVHEQNDLDAAITAHGRILHDATVAGITTDTPADLGGISICETNASSLCEIVTTVIDAVKKDVLDGQMATALLTGIVAETNRFSNEKTFSTTMSVSAKLMTAGANQQLVATKLQETPYDEPRIDPLKINELADEKENGSELPPVVDGSLHIDHELPELDVDIPESMIQKSGSEEEEKDEHPINISEHGEFNHGEEVPEEPKEEQSSERPRLILEPPTLGGTLTASHDQSLDPAIDPLTATAPSGPLLSHDDSAPAPDPVVEETESSNQSVDAPELPGFTWGAQPVGDAMPAPITPLVPEVPATPPAPEAPEQTLADIEKSVDSPHLDIASMGPVVNDALTPDVDQARNAVLDAINVAPVEAPPATPLPPVVDMVPPVAELPVEETPVGSGVEPLPVEIPPAPVFDSTPIETPTEAPIDVNTVNELSPSSQATVNELNIDATGTTGTEFHLPSDLIEENTTPSGEAPPPVPPPMMPPLSGAAPSDDAIPPASANNNPFNLPPA